MGSQTQFSNSCKTKHSQNAVCERSAQPQQEVCDGSFNAQLKSTLPYLEAFVSCAAIAAWGFSNVAVMCLQVYHVIEHITRAHQHLLRCDILSAKCHDSQCLT